MAAEPTSPGLGPRLLLHAVVIALGWIGFVWMWVLVARQPWESQRLAWLIAGSTVALPLITFAWVAHNRSIYRRKGERRAVAAADLSYDHDWHGRRVDADWAALRRCPDITVSVVGDGKRYRDASAGVAVPRASLASTKE